MTISTMYKLSPAFEARDLDDVANHLDSCLIGVDWDWDEMEERDVHVIADSGICYAEAGEEDDPEADITVHVPEEVIADVMENGMDETGLQFEWCEKEWARIKGEFRYHIEAE